MKQANATGEEKATNSVLTDTGSVVSDCNHPLKHLKLLSSTVPGYFIVRSRETVTFRTCIVLMRLIA